MENSCCPGRIEKEKVKASDKQAHQSPTDLSVGAKDSSRPKVYFLKNNNWKGAVGAVYACCVEK